MNGGLKDEEVVSDWFDDGVRMKWHKCVCNLKLRPKLVVFASRVTRNES